jgi:hypothetical protein
VSFLIKLAGTPRCGVLTFFLVAVLKSKYEQKSVLEQMCKFKCRLERKVFRAPMGGRDTPHGERSVAGLSFT